MISLSGRAQIRGFPYTIIQHRPHGAKEDHLEYLYNSWYVPIALSVFAW